MKKVLFIIHEASESGAPLVVKNLLESSYSKGYECFVLSIYGGKIEDKLKNNAQISILYEKRKKDNLFFKILSKLFKSKNVFLKKLDSGFFDLVYVNSVASLVRLPSLSFLNNNKSILHIHEGPILIKSLGAEKILQKEIRKFSRLIFVSNFVKKSIFLDFGLSYTFKFNVIAPVIRNIDDFKLNFKSNHLKLPEKSFVVCSAGSMTYNKGIDVFLQVARRVLDKDNSSESIYFVWIGTNGNEEIKNHLFADINKLGLESNIIVLPNTNEILEYFSEADVFLLTSREESFSMVAMENAFLGNPVICFDKGNGTSEFINNENGAVIPFLDIQVASDEILKMYSDPLIYKQKSTAIKKLANEFSTKDKANEIFNLIGQVINAD